VNIPKQGFVGVGRVTGAAQAIADFEVPVGGSYVPLQDVPELQRYRTSTPVEEQAWFVPVQWMDTVPIAEAIRQVGFFGNQNTVAKPKSEKWEHTVAVLKKRFKIKD